MGKFLSAGTFFLGLALSTAPTCAAVLIDVEQAGNDVKIIASGAFDLTDLGPPSANNSSAAIFPGGSVLIVGSGLQDVYPGLIFLNSFQPFGNAGVTLASSSTGSVFGFSSVALAVPSGYVSNTALSGQSTFSDSTFASLGLTPGQYIYSTQADTITLDIVAAPPNTVSTPEPTSLAILGVGLVGFYVRRRRQQAESGKAQRISPSSLKAPGSL